MNSSKGVLVKAKDVQAFDLQQIRDSASGSRSWWGRGCQGKRREAEALPGVGRGSNWNFCCVPGPPVNSTCASAYTSKAGIDRISSLLTKTQLQRRSLVNPSTEGNHGRDEGRRRAGGGAGRPTSCCHSIMRSNTMSCHHCRLAADEMETFSPLKHGRGSPSWSGRRRQKPAPWINQPTS